MDVVWVQVSARGLHRRGLTPACGFAHARPPAASRMHVMVMDVGEIEAVDCDSSTAKGCSKE